MTQLTTLTPAQVRTVLLGLVDHSSGTRTDQARVDAVGVLVAALTTTRPVDPDLERLRHQLEFVLGEENASYDTDDERIEGFRKQLAALRADGGRLRGQLTALLDLDPWATDEEITEAAAARAAQRAQQRAQEKTQAFVALDELQQALAVLETRRARDDVERQALQVVRQHLDQLTASRRCQAEVHRDTMTSLLGLDPSISDEDLADAVTEAIALRQAAP